MGDKLKGETTTNMLGRKKKPMCVSKMLGHHEYIVASTVHVFGTVLDSLHFAPFL